MYQSKTLTIFFCFMVCQCSPLLKSSEKINQQSSIGSGLDSLIPFQKIPDLSVRLSLLSPALKANQWTLFELNFFSQNQLFWDPDWKVDVWLWMPMPSGSHGSLPVVIQPQYDEQGKIKLGSYRVEGAWFSMTGEWEIYIRLQNSIGESLDQQVVVVWVDW